MTTPDFPAATALPAFHMKPLAWLDQGAADYTLYVADMPIGRFVFGTDNRGQPYHQDPHGEENHATEAEALASAETAYAGLLLERIRSLGVSVAALTASAAPSAPPRASDQAARVAELEEALKSVTASLTAAISLLERSPKTAAPSNKMFDLMLSDYRKSLAEARAALGSAP